MTIRHQEIDSYIGMVITENTTVSGMLIEGGLNIPDQYVVVVTHKNVSSRHIITFGLDGVKDEKYWQVTPSDRTKRALVLGWASAGAEGIHDPEMSILLCSLRNN